MIIRGLGIVCLLEIIMCVMFIALLVWSFSYNLHISFSRAKQRATVTGDKLWEVKLEKSGLILGFIDAEVGCILCIKCSRRVIVTIWLLLWITTFPWIRQKMFELFFYTHYLYTLFMVFYIFHLGFAYSYTVLAGFYLFMVDRYLRFLQSMQRVNLISARLLPCETLELNFFKTPGLSYTPTSIVFIHVAKISKLQWHPFTISSNCNLEPNKLSVIIKSEGTWTKQLYHLLNSSPSPLDCFSVSVEGPYGPVSTHFIRHNMLVLVSGGSGIAPFISIIKELIFLIANNKITNPPKILLISAFKHSLDLTMLDLLPNLNSSLPNMGLKIEAYVTREKKAPLQKPEILRTVLFNPSPSFAPVGPILGSNSWLWLGAIISSSFVFFLIFIGILTRYYIYPIDKNTDTIYSHSSQASFYMLLLCVAIVVSASIAFFWNKKHGEVEANENENMEGEERELESFPCQCLEKYTKVHYGGRPELQKILLGCEEPSNGVLVCGPRSMRHEVAAICSSGSAKNLHFESISFNW